MSKLKLIKWNWNIYKQKFVDNFDDFNEYSFIRVWLNDELGDKYDFKKCKSKKAFIRFLRKNIIPYNYKWEFQLCAKYVWQNSLIYIKK